jgi:hypothetical protein
VNRLDRTSLKIKLGIDSSITDLIIKLWQKTPHH